MVGASLSNNIVAFGKTNILETMTCKVEQCWTIFREWDEVFGLKLCLIGRDMSGYIHAEPCHVQSIRHLKKLLCLQSS
jgi:hypothetical protein